jgi:predicted transcriptional regulator
MTRTEKRQKKTLLSAMEDVMTKAREHDIGQKLYTSAAASLKYLTTTLEISREEALMLSLFFELSSSSRIWISDIARIMNTSNIKVIGMMNVADELARKGYLKRSNKKKDENWYAVPKNVIDSIRENKKIEPKSVACI